MRETSFVKRLKFNFAGGVAKRALVLGDADNDEHNELVCANLQGDLAIFKGKNTEKYAQATNLGMVTACLVGDIFNLGRNHIASINTEGWFFVFALNSPNFYRSSSRGHDSLTNTSDSKTLLAGDDQSQSSSNPYSGGDIYNSKTVDKKCLELELQYDQRMPANCKELLLADLDGDDQNELIVGLTDRVLRTYKWVKIGPSKGKFVGIYKWEFADQIGAVSLNPSSRHENCQDIIVAQPGGTYAKLECFDKKSNHVTISGISDDQKQVGSDSPSATGHTNSSSGSDDNVRTEYISKLTPEYHQLALTQMRNPHISTEVLGGIRDGGNPENSSLIVIATLDGTLMIVNKDEVLWSLQVDHQLFAAALIEPILPEPKIRKLVQSDSAYTLVSSNTQLSPCGRPSDEEESHLALTQPSRSSSNCRSVKKSAQFFAICSWNGKTYIIDEERNYLRFKFQEAVSSFNAGNYYFDGEEHASLVYATFNNRLVLYYDVVSDPIRPLHLLDEIINNPRHNDLLDKLKQLANKIDERNLHDSSSVCLLTGEDSSSRIRCLLEQILYSVSDSDLNLDLDKF